MVRNGCGLNESFVEGFLKLFSKSIAADLSFGFSHKLFALGELNVDYVDGSASDVMYRCRCSSVDKKLYDLVPFGIKG